MYGTVLVTGGLGFIGTRLCHALVDEGYGVRCVDALSGRYAPSTGPAAVPALVERGVDVAVEPARAGHLRGVDAVIHLAALPGVRTPRAGAELTATNIELADELA